MSATAHNSTAAQRARIFDRLQRQPLTTLQARAELDVMHPAARVMELRSLGHEIITQRTQEHSEAGELHCVARYVLMPAGTPRFNQRTIQRNQSRKST